MGIQHTDTLHPTLERIVRSGIITIEGRRATIPDIERLLRSGIIAIEGHPITVAQFRERARNRMKWKQEEYEKRSKITRADQKKARAKIKLIKRMTGERGCTGPESKCAMNKIEHLREKYYLGKKVGPRLKYSDIG